MENPVSTNVQGVGKDPDNKPKLDNETAGFFRLLHQLTMSDPYIIKYRQAMDKLRKKKKEIMARAEAECALIDEQIKAHGVMEEARVTRLRQRFLKKRRHELGLPPIKKEQIHAR